MEDGQHPRQGPQMTFHYDQLVKEMQETHHITDPASLLPKHLKSSGLKIVRDLRDNNRNSPNFRMARGQLGRPQTQHLFEVSGPHEHHFWPSV
jgi:hypothetical protein